MKMGRGVEWALHCCLTLSFVEPGSSVTADQLAAFFDLPRAYLHKQIQLLVRAGIATSVPGPGGGYSLARPPGSISLMDIVAAIDGEEPAFRCMEIRSRGPSGTLGDTGTGAACLIDQAMRRAELAWRRELASQSLASIREQVERRLPALPDRTRRWFIESPR